MDERAYIEVISGRRGGARAEFARAAFGALAVPYRLATGLRNAYYDQWKLPAWLDIPVISVGNITAGGTGKTPLSLWLCRRMLERGLKPAVLSRGYRADQEGRADELMLIARRCPQAVAVGHPNRIAAGQMAIEKYDAQVAILDDGFQHRRLGRDLDIVCIDALEPFGYGHILPRGLLREHPKGLRRADAVIITRCDQVEPETLAAIERAVSGWNREAPILRCAHEPTGFVDLDGQEMSLPDGARTGVFAGIGRPEAFARTLSTFRRPPADTFWWPDHHVYTQADVDELIAWARDARLDALVTTEKDAVKLGRLDVEWSVPVAALRIEIEFWGQGSMILDRLIDEMLEEYTHGGQTPEGSDAEAEEKDPPPAPPC